MARNSSSSLAKESEGGKDEDLLGCLVRCQSTPRLPDGGRHREAQASPLSRMARSKAGYSGMLQEVRAKGENVKERMEMAKRYSRAPSQRKPMEQGLFSMRKWESEKHKSWGFPTEGFKCHVATDGSLLGTAGKWGARGRAVAQLDYDEELGPLHGMYRSMDAEYEVQRTIKRAELTAFLCLLRKVCGPSGQQGNN